MSHTTKTALRFALVLLTLLLLGAAELAAGDSRWYLEAKLGRTDYQDTLGSRWPKFFDGSHDSLSVGVGYSVSRFFAVELGYHDLGSYDGFGSPCAESDEVCAATLQPLILCVEGATDPPCVFPLVATPLTADVTGLSLAAVPRFPFTERLSVYGKVGIIDWDADVSENYPDFQNRRVDSFSDRDFLAAVGLEYTFPIGIGVLAEYQELDFDVSSTSLGASYRF